MPDFRVHFFKSAYATGVSRRDAFFDRGNVVNGKRFSNDLLQALVDQPGTSDTIDLAECDAFFPILFGLVASRGRSQMRRKETLFDIADWLTEPPAGGPVQKWFGGGVLSLVVMLYGLSCCVTQRATTLNMTMRGFSSLGSGLWLEISGVHAITFGLVVTCVGLFIHFQWFWGNHQRLSPFYEYGKYTAAICVVAAVLAHVFTMITRT